MIFSQILKMMCDRAGSEIQAYLSYKAMTLENLKRMPAEIDVREDNSQVIEYFSRVIVLSTLFFSECNVFSKHLEAHR